MSKILIVDDDALIADSVCYSLKLEGFEIDIAENGLDAITKLRDFQPDMVLLDIMLPDISGMEVCRQIRAFSPVPIIMLTARDEEIDRVLGLEVGADDYLSKPFAFRELLARIRAMLRRVKLDQAGQHHKSITVGTLYLDIDARSIFKDEVEIELSAREFDLLAALLKNAGKAISREKLLDIAWGQDWIGDSRTLNVHIRWLRMKLEDDPASPKIIQTVRGYGYRLVSP